MKSLTSLVQAIFYGNFWIATGALCLACQTQYLLTGRFEIMSPGALFLFSGTLFIYSVHRLYGLYKSRPAWDSPYAKFSFLLKINTALSAVACAVCWMYLPDLARWHALVPAVLSLAYTLPVLPGRRRLREVAVLKIFLLCACWAWLTVMVPAAAAGMGWSAVAPVMVLERAAFIFAIGVGFDLRDQQRDQEAGLATLPVKLGKRGAIMCAAFSVFCATMIAGVFAYADLYPTAAFYGSGLCSVLALILVSKAGKTALSPYYFLFALDGLLILQFFLVLL